MLAFSTINLRSKGKPIYFKLGKNMLRIFTICLFAIMLSSCGNDGRTKQDAKEEELIESVVDTVCEQMRELGFPIDLSQITIDVQTEQEMVARFNQISDESRQELNGYTPFGPISNDESRKFRDGAGTRLAFYDPNTKAIVIRQGSLGVLTKGYLAHELAHVYQDQQWGFNKIWSHYHTEPSRELFNITQFMIEGHAELVRSAYEQSHVSSQDANEMSVVLGKMSENDCIPCHTAQTFSTLPYVFGMHFLVNQYRTGGWPVVERFFTDLPQSTEQIIHANKFPNDTPTPLSLPLWEHSSGSKPILNGSLGEAYLLAKLLNLPIPSEQAFRAASGWDGDIAQFYKLGDGREASVWRIAFDRSYDAQQLEDAAKNLGNDNEIFRVGRVVDWIVTKYPDLRKSLRLFLSKNPSRIDENLVDEVSTLEQEKLIENDAKLLTNPYSVPRLVIGPRR